MAYKVRIVGRMEKRLPVAIIVRLAHMQDQSANGEEVTYTDNISAHGARVVSNRRWQIGDMAQVTSLKDETSIYGKVVYCQKLKDDRYGVGLNFHERGVTWSTYSRYSAS